VAKRSRLPRLLIAVLILAAVLVAPVYLSTDRFVAFGGRPAGARLERIRKSPQFVDGKFHNSLPTNRLVPGKLWEVLRHQLFGHEERVPKRAIPVVMHAAADYAVAPAGLRATWIGHATTLIELDGRRVLTDPIWSDRCSPSTWVGPTRFHPPPIALADLPLIDAVVISHDHYDHLDMMTVRALAARGTRFAVPLGIGAHLEAFGVPTSQIIELDWGETAEVNGLKLTSTPARHYSGRNPLHGDETLWSSWVIAGPFHRVFFSGDSGYFEGFKATGKLFGPFDLTLVKIGASDPTWVEIHMDPEQAVQVNRDLGGGLLMPVHWGTFNLAYHAWNEPAERVLAAAQRAGVKLVVPRPGEQVDPAHPRPVEPWWR